MIQFSHTKLASPGNTIDFHPGVLFSENRRKSCDELLVALLLLLFYYDIKHI
jgi:hypothetical protein